MRVVKSMVNARSLQLQYSRVLQEPFFVPIISYDNEKKMSRITAVQVGNLREFWGIRRIYIELNRRVSCVKWRRAG